MNIDQLVSELMEDNRLYRMGTPRISDDMYDAKVETLRRADPSHEYLHQVEPEPDDTFGGKKVVHAERMLSMNKAYTINDLERFFSSVRKAAEDCGVYGDLVYSVQPKLDGISGNRAKTGTLATRGKHGIEGEDITIAVDRGLILESKDPYGVGELVVNRKYFEEHLAYDEELNPDGFMSPRSFMAGLASSDEMSTLHKKAIDAGVAKLVFYKELTSEFMTEKEIIANLDDIQKRIRLQCEYDTDGIVISVDNEIIRKFMGATQHHHRHQIAFKQKGVTADTTIRSITRQTGRTGHVTPVAHFDPVLLPGALVSKATVHNYRILKERGIGVGARITIIRSGEVIPKIEKVLETSQQVDVPDFCPSCGSHLVEDGAFLTCVSSTCDAQLSASLYHFFHIINVAKGFGEATVEKLVLNGISSIPRILSMTSEDFRKIGFGDKQSDNLAENIMGLKNTMIPEWILLSSLGIHHLGRGSSISLLKSLGSIHRLLDARQSEISDVSGFGSITSPYIHAALRERRDIILHLLDILNVQVDDSSRNGAFKDMIMVFTGSMAKPREEMQELARQNGAQIGSSVSRKTSVLVTGADVGTTKISKAKSLGIKIWTEAEFMSKL